VFKAILCPVDFSEHSERALAVATDVAALTSGHLTIVTVVDELLDAASHDSLAAQTQQEIKDLLARFAAHHDRPCEYFAISVVVGDPAEQILKQAGECAADLIVMGTQGVGAVERFMFGSTAERVLRESRIPVLAVPAIRAENRAKKNWGPS
jgi:nucleotide-binding universal stress UspA family protein